MINIIEFQKIIVDTLKPINPERIILFGSHAHGTPEKDSDIDLYIVTKDEYIPKSYNEKMDLKLKVAYLLDDLRNQYPFDVIIHTRPMMQEFKKQNSSLSREIFTKGIVLL